MHCAPSSLTGKKQCTIGCTFLFSSCCCFSSCWCCSKLARSSSLSTCTARFSSLILATGMESSQSSMSWRLSTHHCTTAGYTDAGQAPKQDVVIVNSKIHCKSLPILPTHTSKYQPTLRGNLHFVSHSFCVLHAIS